MQSGPDFLAYPVGLMRPSYRPHKAYRVGQKNRGRPIGRITRLARPSVRLTRMG